MLPPPVRVSLATAVAVLALVGASGCRSAPAPNDSGTSTPADTAPSDTDPTTASAGGATGGGTTSSDQDPGSSGDAAAASSVATAPDPAELCAGLVAAESGRVANGQLDEASGLAASQQLDGVLWAHNDSGSTPAVFALGTDGADLGQVEVPVTAWVDVEDMAVAADQLYLADIGDNDREREEITVLRFDEPDPASGIAGEVEEIRLRYPDRAHDAEAFLVDPITGALVVIAKEVQLSLSGDSVLSPAPATVFVATPPFPAGQVTVVEPAGTIALDDLATRAQAPSPAGLVGELGVGGVATAADIRRDGRVIAIRTYATVWLFARAEGQSIAEALATEPCEAPTVPEEQGEAVAFLDGSTNQMVTIGEGLNPAVNAARTG